MSLVDALLGPDRVIAAELRPPRAELDAAAGMDAWIDTYHSVRSLVRRGTHVLLTDSAVGLREEDNLRHLITNLGKPVGEAAFESGFENGSHFSRAFRQRFGTPPALIRQQAAVSAF